MKYAVIKTGGKQYRVSEGDILEVERLTHDGKTITFGEVLLYVNDAHSLVGAPLLSDVVVTADILGDMKGDKIRVSQFKAKARYRRVQGHRQSLTKVKISQIRGKDDKPAKKVETAPKVEKGSVAPKVVKKKAIVKKSKTS